MLVSEPNALRWGHGSHPSGMEAGGTPVPFAQKEVERPGRDDAQVAAARANRQRLAAAEAKAKRQAKKKAAQQAQPVIEDFVPNAALAAYNGAVDGGFVLAGSSGKRSASGASGAAASSSTRAWNCENRFRITVGDASDMYATSRR